MDGWVGKAAVDTTLWGGEKLKCWHFFSLYNILRSYSGRCATQLMLMSALACYHRLLAFCEWRQQQIAGAGQCSDKCDMAGRIRRSAVLLRHMSDALAGRAGWSCLFTWDDVIGGAGASQKQAPDRPSRPAPSNHPELID